MSDLGLHPSIGSLLLVVLHKLEMVMCDVPRASTMIKYQNIGGRTLLVANFFVEVLLIGRVRTTKLDRRRISPINHSATSTFFQWSAFKRYFESKTLAREMAERTTSAVHRNKVK